MPQDFIPSQDANALLWMQTFANTIAADPAGYMVTAADATTISNAVAAYASALAIAVASETRTPVSISLKDETRNSAEQVCRQYAGLIKLNVGISNQAKIAAGVRPVNTEREAIPAPATSPIVSPIASTMGSQTLRFSDAMTPDSPAKPFGATDLLLFVAIADNNVDDPGLANFIGKFTKNPISVQFNNADNGKQATYFARWSSRRGEVGPWSVPVSLAIAA
jgi:hypothetical protein